MKVATSPADYADLAGAHRIVPPIGLVPTMGAFHAGHEALMHAAREACDEMVVSLFVNPTQFDEPGDFAAYPRVEEDDAAIAERAGASLLFAPSAQEIYPAGFATRITVSGLSDVLEGRHRPGHFDGVCTVVAMLFNLVEPDLAFFGQKDAQQAAIIQAMARDLSYRTRVVVCPTVREDDGLALSSRNAYLTPEGRNKATVLYSALRAGADTAHSGGRVEDVEARMKDVLAVEGVDTDYARAVDPGDFSPWDSGPALLLVAARVESTRLIDNLVIGTSADPTGDTR